MMLKQSVVNLVPTRSQHIRAERGSDRDQLSSVLPLAQMHNLSIEALVNLHTLSDRIQEEVTSSNSVVSFVPLVGVWARKPADAAYRKLGGRCGSLRRGAFFNQSSSEASPESNWSSW